MSQALSAGAITIDHALLYRITETMAKASKDNDKVCVIDWIYVYHHI